MPPCLCYQLYLLLDQIMVHMGIKERSVLLSKYFLTFTPLLDKLVAGSPDRVTRKKDVFLQHSWWRFIFMSQECPQYTASPAIELLSKINGSKSQPLWNQNHFWQTPSNTSQHWADSMLTTPKADQFIWLFYYISQLVYFWEFMASQDSKFAITKMCYWGIFK